MFCLKKKKQKTTNKMLVTSDVGEVSQEVIKHK